MDEMKKLLFEATLAARKRYDKYRKEYGKYKYLTDTTYFRFSALYTLIETAGLEEEYQEWKQQQKK